MDLSIDVIWMSPFLVYGVPGECFYFNSACILHRNLGKQTEQTWSVATFCKNVASELGLLCLHNNPNKNSAEGYVAPGKDHVSMTCNCNSYS